MIFVWSFSKNALVVFRSIGNKQKQRQGLVKREGNYMKKLFWFLGLGIMLLTAGFSVKAGLTNAVYWNFSLGGASSTSNSFSGLTVSSLSQGNSGASVTLLNASSPSSGYSTAAGYTASGGTNAEIVARVGALNTGASGSAYLAFSFSLGAASTLSYDVTNISFGSRSTTTGPQLLSLYDSTDGFASSSLLSSVSVAANGTWAAVSFYDLSVSIPNDSSIISFRIYGSNGTGSNSSSVNWRIDDLGVALSPVSSVPEPPTADLSILGGLFGFWLLSGTGTKFSVGKKRRKIDFLGFYNTSTRSSSTASALQRKETDR